ncbi:MAG: DNA topoisomerase I [Parcubacteria group bacterium Gr01-1014_3]|nr:MAG: DNA topoisomerase I [Parcubacteria group bacterium Gr01-1014_3]
MKLIIVESPTKAKTISKFLGPDYKVESSYGHVRDLPKSKLGVDLENNFELQYVIPVKARKVVNQLKKDAKDSDEVILATDEDREGEAIAWHLSQALGLKDQKNIKRIVFHEITKAAIEKALQNPRSLDLNMVDAQQARRALDRLVGYKLSPFLWKKVARGLSAGRVQSVAVRLIVDRENEIRAFKPEEYYTIIANLKAESVTAPVEALLSKIDGKSLEKFDIKNGEQANEIVSDLKKQKFVVSNVEKRTAKKNPPPPFITSTLQQEAVKRLGFSSKKTMFIAQRLYEQGLITYMRTDSVNLSQDALIAAKSWLEKTFGAEYAAAAPRVFAGKSRLAQEAHEAIRPTDVSNAPEDLKDESDKKLYKMIWQRFLGSQMPEARVALSSLEITAGKYTLKASGQQIIFDGYLKIWPQKFSEKELPVLAKNSALDLAEANALQHFTEPPARYSEASLIKVLEEYGIGRPSTYAPIISVIQTRNYVQKEKGRFVPTETGELVNKVMTEHFAAVVDIDFTANMEEELDHIADGKEKWQDVIGKFYGPFAKNLEEKYLEVSKAPEETTDEKCEKCGKPMLIKAGRFGKFMACSGFPDCKTTKPLPKSAPKLTGIKCEKCGEGELVERRVNKGRARGKFFWGCSKYPKCDNATWQDPTKKEGEGVVTDGAKAVEKPADTDSESETPEGPEELDVESK